MFILQIEQVEKELVRLSSLELRKELLSLEDKSYSMLEQRNALVSLLKKLFRQKSSREQELEDWVNKIEDVQEGGKDAADFWLVQYQRLMDMKPAGLAEAENKLEDAVVTVLQTADALHLRPLFARHQVTFDALMNMTDEDALVLGMRGEVYGRLQEALQQYLTQTKLGGGEASPSAPGEKEVLSCDPSSPSAPQLQHIPTDEEEPSAPSLAYVEPECVVCLERPSSLVLLPCGHVCLCQQCAVAIVQCPLCRTTVTAKLVFGSLALENKELDLDVPALSTALN